MAEHFGQSASRHLRDAQLLLDAHRPDNAVYLAGYVVECSFKLLVQVHLGVSAARSFSHDLGELQRDAVALMRALFPWLDGKLPISSTAGTVLDEDHPVRRYSNTGRWTEAEAVTAVLRAEQIHAEIIPPLILDGFLAEGEI